MVKAEANLSPLLEGTILIFESNKNIEQMDFILPMSIMALIIIFLAFRLIFLAGKFIYAKDITIDQFQLYDGEFPERWAKEIFEYLSINKEQFPKAYKLFESPISNIDWAQIGPPSRDSSTK